MRKIIYVGLCMILVILIGCKQEEECKSSIEQEIKIRCEINEEREHYSNPYYISFPLDYNQTEIIKYMEKYECKLKIETYFWICSSPDICYNCSFSFTNQTNKSVK